MSRDACKDAWGREGRIGGLFDGIPYDDQPPDRSRELLAIERRVGGALAEAAREMLALGYSVDEAGEMLSAMFAENDALAEIFIEARDA